MVIFILNISIVNLFKQSNEVALFLPFSATYGVGGAPGRTANIHFQFRRFENAVVDVYTKCRLRRAGFVCLATGKINKFSDEPAAV